MAKYKFKNTGADHVLKGGKTILRDETFETNQDLRGIFKNKFELVGGGEEAPEKPSKRGKAKGETEE